MRYGLASGRSTQEETIGLAGGLNLYGFANGDPVNFSDPFGLLACPPLCDNLDYTKDHFLLPTSGRDALITGATVLGAAMGGIALAAGAEFALGAGAIGLPAASAAASKVPFKDFQEWGRSAVGWGQRASGAAQAMSDMTAQKAATLDPAKVRAAQAFY